MIIKWGGFNDCTCAIAFLFFLLVTPKILKDPSWSEINEHLSWRKERPLIESVRPLSANWNIIFCGQVHVQVRWWWPANQKEYSRVSVILLWMDGWTVVHTADVKYHWPLPCSPQAKSRCFCHLLSKYPDQWPMNEWMNGWMDGLGWIWIKPQFRLWKDSI